MCETPTAQGVRAERFSWLLSKLSQPVPLPICIYMCEASVCGYRNKWAEIEESEDEREGRKETGEAELNSHKRLMFRFDFNTKWHLMF